MNDSEDEIICDLAETYHIFDFKGLPPSMVATLVFGLRDNSRVKMKLSGMNIDLKTLLLSRILDDVELILWSKTNGKAQKPKSITNALMKKEDKNDVQSFDNAEDFEKEKNRILGKE